MAARRPLLRAAALVAAALAPTAASAHGFGQRFDLPVPLAFWLTAAGASIVLSFVVMAIFVRPRAEGVRYPRLDLARVPGIGLLARPAVAAAARIAAVLVLALTVVAGFAGNSDPYHNLAPTMVWVIWWVGLAFVCALIGDLWAVINPLDAVYGWWESRRARRTGAPPAPLRAWPRWLGAWPAALIFLGFAWVELLWVDRDVPRELATLIVVYALVTWAGMRVFGRATWLRNAEAFSLAFGVLARFAPTERRVRDAAVIGACPIERCATRAADGSCVNGVACVAASPAPAREWNLRPPAVGLLEGGAVSLSLTMFVLVMLARVTFDGFIETGTWLKWVNWLMAAPHLSIWLENLQNMGIDELMVLHTGLLIAFPLFFLTAFLVTCQIMLFVAPGAEGRPSALALARRFVLTLVPIAIAYHLAHYLSMLLTTGQFLIPLASDPLGLGWNLFGTAGYKVQLNLVGARFIWYSAVSAIVVGHVCSVYLAHVVAARTWRTGRGALVSQVPMVVLMVGYTTLSLWILAQPIVA